MAYPRMMKVITARGSMLIIREWDMLEHYMVSLKLASMTDIKMMLFPKISDLALFGFNAPKMTKQDLIKICSI